MKCSRSLERTRVLGECNTFSHSIYLSSKSTEQHSYSSGSRKRLNTVRALYTRGVTSAFKHGIQAPVYSAHNTHHQITLKRVVPQKVSFCYVLPDVFCSESFSTNSAFNVGDNHLQAMATGSSPNAFDNTIYIRLAAWLEMKVKSRLFPNSLSHRKHVRMFVIF